MGDFGSILRRGKKMFDIKDSAKKWERCEECNKRDILYAYRDKEDQPWWLCEECITIYTKEDEE
jgi:hypothetical protein